MRAMPSFTSRTVPTSSMSSSLRSAASISRSRMSLISPGRSVVSVAIKERSQLGAKTPFWELVKNITREAAAQVWGSGPAATSEPDSWTAESALSPDEHHTAGRARYSILRRDGRARVILYRCQVLSLDETEVVLAQSHAVQIHPHEAWFRR